MGIEGLTPEAERAHLERVRNWRVLEKRVLGLFERTLERQRQFAPGAKEDAFPQNEFYRATLKEIQHHLTALKPNTTATETKKFDQRYGALHAEIKNRETVEQALLKKFGDGQLDLNRDFLQPLLDGLSNLPNALGLGSALVKSGLEVKEHVDEGNLQSAAIPGVFLATMLGRGKLKGLAKGKLFKQLSETAQLQVLTMETHSKKVANALAEEGIRPEFKKRIQEGLVHCYEALEKATNTGTLQPARELYRKKLTQFLDETTMARKKTTAEEQLRHTLEVALAELERFL